MKKRRTVHSFLALYLAFALPVSCKNDEDNNPGLEILAGLLQILTTGTLQDVHGAGAQRSDPKSGDPDDYPTWGKGPQGDVQRVYNYARCVRGSTGSQESGKSYAIVDTAQSKCFDDGTSGEITCPSSSDEFYGQDGNYTSSTSVSTLEASYKVIEHDDGDVVIDENTGLMWTRSFRKTEFDDRDTLAGSISDGGYTDWRVPTIKELYSLMQFDGRTGSADPTVSTAPSDADPYIDESVFDFEYPSSPSRYIDAQYISKTIYTGTVMGDVECFFGLNQADGRIKCYPKSGNLSDSTFYIRFVRDYAGSDYGVNSFRDNGDDTITDQASGLTWLKNDSGNSDFASSLESTATGDGSLNFKESLAFCENLSFAGQSDWRLPDAKELQSIVDYTRGPDATSSAAIDPLFNTTQISNEAGEDDYPAFWSSTTHLDGPDDGSRGVYVLFGRGMGFI